MPRRRFRSSPPVLRVAALVLLIAAVLAQVGPPAAQTATVPGVPAYLPLIQTICDLPAGRILPAPEVYEGGFPVNFGVAAADLQRRGLNLAFNKIGFHVAVGGNRTGIIDYYRQLDEAGVPFFLKSVNDGGALLEAIQVTSGPHVFVFRRTGNGSDGDGGFDYDVPDYGLSPGEAAERHWRRHLSAFPPELIPYKDRIWLETVNEVDKNRSAWLAEFAIETARLALRDGYNWAAFGWSSGEPEPDHWREPAMLDFLRLAAAYPDRLAVALHEYSYTTSDIRHAYPYLIGRFQHLFDIVDAYDIGRPTVLITEWGWEYDDVPLPEQALADIAWAARLYAYYPEVKGAALWYLGPNFGGIANEAQQLIVPVGDYSVRSYFGVSGGVGCLDPELFRGPVD